MEVPVEMPEGVSYEGILGAVVAQPQAEYLLARRRMMPQSLARTKSMKARRSRPSPANAKMSMAPKFETSDLDTTDFMSQERERGITIPESVDCFSDSADEKFLEAYSENSVDFQLPALSLSLEQDSASSTNARLQLIQAIGLDEAGQKNLQQHLQNVNIPPNINGEIVLELQVKGKRVLRVILDDEVSTLKDKKVVEEIKRSLLKWRVPSGAAEKILITIKVSS
ncbi:after-VIT domain-containing protein [Hydrocoleum sp. CS-953]|uniref:after-VIT domain-containing protein n=1 Tax=Hydrocoleum sp. CS-953 TaxID=1671698 RepID=UPI000B9B886B